MVFSNHNTRRHIFLYVLGISTMPLYIMEIYLAMIHLLGMSPTSSGFNILLRLALPDPNPLAVVSMADPSGTITPPK
jgi:hypothetical protein